MEQALDRSDIEVIELDESDDSDAFTPEKLVGVALVGAVSSLFLYYLFHQLDPDKRDRIKSSAVSALRGQVRRWSEEEED